MKVVGGSADGGAPGLGAAKRHDRIRSVLRSEIRPARGQFTSHAPLDLSIHDTCSHARPIAGQPPSIMMDVTDGSSPDATLHNSIVGAAAASQHQLSATCPKTQGFDAHDSVV